MAMVAATRGGGQGRLDLRAGPGCCGALGCDCGGSRKKRVHPTLSAREIDREREARIATLFDAHDISGSGTLKDGELKAFMEETSSTGTGRYETDYTVTDEDVAYVMAVAGAVNTPGEVDKEDVKLALRAWGSLLHDQTTIQSRFEDYANAKTGMMDSGQLSEMLTDLKNEKVSDEDVAHVFKIADKNSNGMIELKEAQIATAVWYTISQQQEADAAGGGSGGGCCVIS